MFKFLRRYNKWILAVGGTLLLIVFLIPQAIQGLSQAAAQQTASQATVGTDGKEVAAAELQTVREEMQYMQQIGLRPPVMDRMDNPWHWYLLVREAEEAGLVGAGLGIPPEQLRNAGFRASVVEGVITKFAGVSRLVAMYQSAAQFSDHRLRGVAQRLFHRVTVQPVIIKATPDAPGYTPTDDEIRTQMETYADFAPDDPESRFGYRLPDRVKLEWLVISADSVRELIEATDLLDGTALRKHWRQNPGGNRAFPPIPAVATASIPDVVREDLADRVVAEKLEALGRFCTNQLRARTHQLERDESYLKLPANWANERLGFDALAGTLVEKEGISLPAYHQVSDRWLDPVALGKLAGLGKATTDSFPPTPTTLADLVAVAREFKGSTTIQVQSGVAGPWLQGEDGTVYLWRILDTDASRPPNSPDEVRQQVVDDLKRLRNFESMVASIDTLRREAVDKGLISLALDHDTIVQRQQDVSLFDQLAITRQTILRQPLTPEPSPLPEIGADEATIEAIIDRAESLEGDMDELSDDQRTLALPVNDKLAIVVVRLMGQKPLTESNYKNRAANGHIQQILWNQELGVKTVAEAFSYESLCKRHNFKPLISETEPATTDVAAANTDTE